MRTHCGSDNFVKNCSYNASQRYKCKKCFSYFSDKVREFSYKDKERAVMMHLKDSDIRKVAEIMNRSAFLVVRWCTSHLISYIFHNTISNCIFVTLSNAIKTNNTS